MTGTFHDYVATQLAAQLKQRIVVWYDPRAEFEPFIRQVIGGEANDLPVAATVGDVSAHVVVDDGSRYATRFRAEPLVAADEPTPVLVYLPGVKREGDSSVLMELECAGGKWEPQLRHLARNALRQRYTDGVIDELLNKESTTYDDIARALAADGAQPPTALKTILKSTTPDSQVAEWLAHDVTDAGIVAKEALDELGKLVTSRLGLALDGDDLTKWRRIVARTALGFEFRSDLQTVQPSQLASLPAATADQERNARAICQALRAHHGDEYPAIADQAATELQLGEYSIDPLELGSIDTFRFEERSLLRACGELVRDGQYQRVLDVHAQRSGSFWLTQELDRQAQWEAIRLAAELGVAADTVDADLAKPPRTVADWVDRYSERWHVLDRAQRHLEAWIPKLDDDPDEIAINAVRNRYDATLDRLALGFTDALQAASWDTAPVLPQTSVFDQMKPTQGPVAYFLVDAMRYEMGAELASRLTAHAEVSIRPALSVLPSITVTGMAALMPGAAQSYDVVAEGGKLQARIGDNLLPNLATRKKHLAARVPASVDMELSDVLSTSRKGLEKKIGKAELIVVRSQDIDLFGEGGSSAARTVMNTVIDQLVQAVRKLADVGVGRAVLASDHGHIYASRDREEAMRIDAPGGDTVELHRRCWIGRGGATPSATVRVAASSLGNNNNDLDFVFPKGCGVLKAGGDLAFHHGGISLQEMVIPVISVRSKGSTSSVSAPAGAQVEITEVPDVITNRIFTVKLRFAGMYPPPVRPVLITDGREAGTVQLAPGAQLDRSTGIVTLAAGETATLGFVLEDDAAPSVRVVVIDPSSDAELYRSPADIAVQLGVG